MDFFRVISGLNAFLKTLRDNPFGCYLESLTVRRNFDVSYEKFFWNLLSRIEDYLQYSRGRRSFRYNHYEDIYG